MSAPVHITSTASTAICCWSSGSGNVARGRDWWKVEARRLGSDWRGIASTAWLDPEWRRAARDYRGDK
jgi:hypothetical protein